MILPFRHNPSLPRRTGPALMLAALLASSLRPAVIHAGDQSASADSGGVPFQAFSVTLQPQVTTSPLPSWATPDMLSIQPGTDSVSLGIPALASQDEIGAFALTVIFRDNGDGGPVVEWLSKDGISTLLSAGLGKTGVPLGLNSRTLLIGQALALDGGTIRISFAGRFERLISIALRPAKEVEVGSLDQEARPALLSEKDRIFDVSEVSGAEAGNSGGDNYRGLIIDAELSAAPVRLDFPGGQGTVEFDVPLGETPSGAYLYAEIGGLDPASSVQVELNGNPCGTVQLSPFALDDPSVVFSSTGRLQLAGWRKGSLFLPAALFQQGENAVVLTLQRSPGDSGDPSSPVYLQKTRLDLLLSPHQPSGQTSVSPITAPSPSGTPAAETLSNGSLSGTPPPSLFHAPAPTSIQSEDSPATTGGT